jgi:hypothetical protein
MKSTGFRNKQTSLSLFSGSQSGNEGKQSGKTHSTVRDTTKRTKTQSQGIVKVGNEMKWISFCSRSQYCPAMKCPLDPFIDMRMEYNEELDGEFKDSRCTMAKATRHRYWESMPDDMKKDLPFQGYFRSEYNRMEAARRRWEGMSEDERTRIREMGRARLAGSRRSQS